jgi:hypothetical protein
MLLILSFSLLFQASLLWSHRHFISSHGSVSISVLSFKRNRDEIHLPGWKYSYIYVLLWHRFIRTVIRWNSILWDAWLASITCPDPPSTSFIFNFLQERKICLGFQQLSFIDSYNSICHLRGRKAIIEFRNGYIECWLNIA